MIVITVSGSRSNVGKSSLAEKLVSLFEGAAHVKIGHGKRKPEIRNHFYPEGTEFGEIAGDGSR